MYVYHGHAHSTNLNSINNSTISTAKPIPNEIKNFSMTPVELCPALSNSINCHIVITNIPIHMHVHMYIYVCTYNIQLETTYNVRINVMRSGHTYAQSYIHSIYT